MQRNTFEASVTSFCPVQEKAAQTVLVSCFCRSGSAAYLTTFGPVADDVNWNRIDGTSSPFPSKSARRLSIA
jgi:hypothetical protein